MSFDFTEKFYRGQKVYDREGASYTFNESFMFDTGGGFDLVAECVSDENGLKSNISETLLTGIAPAKSIADSPEGRVLASVVGLIAGIHSKGDPKVIFSPDELLSYVDNRLAEEGLTRK
ncbi:hypothetical protein [Dyadobacter sp. 32]|uniref:hypothetical protein n=1 Tax=Dyadobacter sp. 32 TaxID=538966 RepID=UPI0011F0478F